MNEVGLAPVPNRVVTVSGEELLLIEMEHERYVASILERRVKLLSLELEVACHDQDARGSSVHDIGELLQAHEMAPSAGARSPAGAEVMRVEAT